jgi:soluble lytic murein transglycosylase-like protein
MDVVTRANAHAACVVGLLLMNTVAAADRPVYCGTERWRSLIAEASTRFEIPQVWLHAVIRAESAGCEVIDGHPITSAAGAMGLMQLMPATWNEYRERLTLGNDPYNPRDNILAGAAYLRELYDRYGAPGFIAAYHAGPKRYEAYRLGESSLPAATFDYLHNISPESRITATVPTIAASANPHPIGDLFIPLKHTDLREDNTANEPRKAPPDARSE